MEMAVSPAVLNGAIVSRRTLPRNLRPQDEPLFRHEYQMVIPASVLLPRRDVTILPYGWFFDGWRIDPEGCVNRSMPPLKVHAKALADRWLSAFQGRDHRDEGLWVTDHRARAYYHWMTEALPRLHVARHHGVDGPLLLPAHYARLRFVAETLPAYGIDGPVYLSGDRVTVVSRLNLVTPTAPSGNFSDALFRDVGARLRKHFAPGTRPSRRIYISRHLATRRRVRNEDRLLPILSRFGFEIVHMEKLSMAEQVAVCSEAAILVSNHGAGLTNMMFMAPGGRVMEIRKEGDDHSNSFFAEASATGLDYFYMLAPPANPVRSAHMADVIVDPRRFEAVLAELCA
jgi:capsular polysaccharide biosynthesis protein